jgi:hypothetical protein
VVVFTVIYLTRYVVPAGGLEWGAVCACVLKALTLRGGPGETVKICWASSRR